MPLTAAEIRSLIPMLTPNIYYTTKVLTTLSRLPFCPEAVVNWDPADGTVLADEQVDAQGRSWRSGALVERRLLRQWFVRTTRFSERLLHSLDSAELRDWRDIIQMQKHWIGPCDGWKFELQVEDRIGKMGCRDDVVSVTSVTLHIELSLQVDLNHNFVLWYRLGNNTSCSFCMQGRKVLCTLYI